MSILLLFIVERAGQPPAVRCGVASLFGHIYGCPCLGHISGAGFTVQRGSSTQMRRQTARQESVCTLEWKSSGEAKKDPDVDMVLLSFVCLFVCVCF